MIDPRQFRTHIVRAVLRDMGMWSQPAENLLVGTALQESGLRYLRQLNNGPALGVYQTEPATLHDLFDNWRANEYLARPEPDRLVYDLAYATKIARLIYYRRPEPLPAAEDVDGLANYWKQHYNTPLGAGTAAEWALKYREHAVNF